MYKDKPNYAPPKLRNGMNGNKIGLIMLVVFAVLWLFGLIPTPHWAHSGDGSDYEAKMWKARRDAVTVAFTRSWDHYAQHAWGADVFNPVAQTSKNIGCHRQYKNVNCPPTGWIVVDALDTAMIMNLTSRVANAREWIATSLDFSKVDSEMNTFETTIRILGGLLSAHHLSTTYPDLTPLKEDDVGQRGEDLYIEKATDLAERLLGAFETPHGIPLTSVKLNTSEAVGDVETQGNVAVAEVTSIQLEMKYMAKLTGEPLHWLRAEQAMEAVDGAKREGDLPPILIDPLTGRFWGDNVRVGARSDSYYECLYKQFLQTGSREKVYKEMWEEALEGIKEHLITWSKHGDLTVLGERPQGIHEDFLPKMDHLTCFLPGAIALGVTGGKNITQAKEDAGESWGKLQEENLILAEELMKTCYGMYLTTPTGLAPEITYFDVGSKPRKWDKTDPEWSMPRSKPFTEDPDALWRRDFKIHEFDRHNLQRPEVVESLFIMWRITQNPQYREWGWRIFQSYIRHSAIYDAKFQRVVGYTSIPDVNIKHDTVPLALFAPPDSNKAESRIRIGDTMEHDKMEGFWLSETLKYLYLMFDDDIAPWNDLEKIVLTTEGHFLPRFDIGTEGKVWRTGWTRKERLVSQNTQKS